jgi:hypothetical protein
MDMLVARGCGVSFDEVLQPPDSSMISALSMLVEWGS